MYYDTVLPLRSILSQTLSPSSKSSKYFVKQVPRSDSQDGMMMSPPPPVVTSPSSINRRRREEASSSLRRIERQSSTSSWRIKTQQEYIQSLTPAEIRKKGGLAKLEKQPTNRYFKRKRLRDIIMLHGHSDDREQLGLFVHFLMGLLDPDPWKRWTAYQASQHPFLTGSSHRRLAARILPSTPTTTATANSDDDDKMITSTTGQNNDKVTTSSSSGSSSSGFREFDIYWVPPWDPSICRRKLLNVQKTREKQQARQQQQQQRSQQQKQRTEEAAGAPHRGEVLSSPVAGNG